jgi:transcriptional regulator with XRE-family HTH domain
MALLGEHVAALRKQRGWTQWELDRRASLGRGYTAMIETHQRRNPSLRTLCRLARALDVSLDTFCPDATAPNNTPEAA